MYSPKDETQRNNETQALSTDICLHQVAEDRWIITLKGSGIHLVCSSLGCAVLTFMIIAAFASFWLYSQDIVSLFHCTAVSCSSCVWGHVSNTSVGSRGCVCLGGGGG